MKTISITQFCKHYKIPVSFIDSLSRYELVDLVELDDTKHISIEDIRKLESLIHLHYDLEVNFEGIDIINRLTAQVDALQRELDELKNLMDFYQ